MLSQALQGKKAVVGGTHQPGGRTQWSGPEVGKSRPAGLEGREPRRAGLVGEEAARGLGDRVRPVFL